MVFGFSWKSICDEGVEALRKGLKCECVPALEIVSTIVMEVIKINKKINKYPVGAQFFFGNYFQN